MAAWHSTRFCILDGRHCAMLVSHAFQPPPVDAPTVTSIDVLHYAVMRR
jgi:hypothetical protein